MHCKQIDPVDKLKIYRVRISQDNSGCYTFSVKHTGKFNLGDYEKLEFEVKSTRFLPSMTQGPFYSQLYFLQEFEL